MEEVNKKMVLLSLLLIRINEEIEKKEKIEKMKKLGKKEKLFEINEKLLEINKKLLEINEPNEPIHEPSIHEPINELIHGHINKKATCLKPIAVFVVISISVYVFIFYTYTTGISNIIDMSSKNLLDSYGIVI